MTNGDFREWREGRKHHRRAAAAARKHLRKLDNKPAEEPSDAEDQRYRREKQAAREAHRARKRAAREARLRELSARRARSDKYELWRWLALTVGGSALPFFVLGGVYWLVTGHNATFQAVLGRGDLLIPSSIMNAEAIWIVSYVVLLGRSVWFPIVCVTCGLAALAGALCFGATAALDSASHNSVQVAPNVLQQLARHVTILSVGEFILAFLVGTVGVVLFMLTGRRKEDTAS